MICDLQAIAPLTDAAKRIQEAEESGKTFVWFVWFICIIVRTWGQFVWILVKSFFFGIFEEQD